MDNFLIGVASSLTAAFVAWLAVKCGWPAFQDRVLYKGIRVAGTWNIVEERNGRRVTVGQIEIRQRGRTLTGTSLRSKKRDGTRSNRKFQYTGHIDGQQVTMLFEDQSGVGFDAGSYVFAVQNDGVTMVGMATFHGKTENQIVSESRTLEKVPT